VTETVQRIV